MSLMHAFSKSVRRETIDHHEIIDAWEIEKIENVIQKLKTLPKVSTLRLDELHIMTNPRNWVTSLLNSYPDNIREEEMEYLLLDFTEAMRTRMREESKYAIGLLKQNELILCHSLLGEETITPEWKTIPRMLDSDNILRYVCFLKERDTISVVFWERESSDSFIAWLGLPGKQAFLFGGKYRIHCKLEDITTELQLTEEEIDKWMKNHPEFEENQIKLSRPIELLSVSDIRAWRKTYENARDFIQDYKSQSYGIPYYQEQYTRVNKEFLPLLMTYYDEKTQLVRIEAEEKTIEVVKSTPQFDILFVNRSIQLRANYLMDIANRFINDEPIRICHAGLRFKASPFILGSMEIYNEIQTDHLTQLLTDYYNSFNLQDRNLQIILKYSIIQKLAWVNTDLPIAHLFTPLAQEIIRHVVLQGRWSKLEDKILEYKSSDFFIGGNREIVEKLSQDLTKKLRQSQCKVYIIGIEDDGMVNPLPASRLQSDRLGDIRSNVENEVEGANVYALPVIEGKEGILLVLALAS